jgi:hypothetical protein
MDDVFPVGLDGQVYLRDVSHGTPLWLEWRDNRCGLTLDLDGAEGLVPDLGEVPCVGRAAQ